MLIYLVLYLSGTMDKMPIDDEKDFCWFWRINRLRNYRKMSATNRPLKTMKFKCPWFVMAETILHPNRLPVTELPVFDNEDHRCDQSHGLSGLPRQERPSLRAALRLGFKCLGAAQPICFYQFTNCLSGYTIDFS